MVAIKILGKCGLITEIIINCDNLPVVEVLRSGRAGDSTFAAFARNIWLLTYTYIIQLNIIHIQGSKNSTSDSLFRWQDTNVNIEKLNKLLPNHIWLNAHKELMLFTNEIDCFKFN